MSRSHIMNTDVFPDLNFLLDKGRFRLAEHLALRRSRQVDHRLSADGVPEVLRVEPVMADRMSTFP